MRFFTVAGKGHVIINFFQTGNRDFKVENREFKVENRDFEVAITHFELAILHFEVAIPCLKKVNNNMALTGHRNF